MRYMHFTECRMKFTICNAHTTIRTLLQAMRTSLFELFYISGIDITITKLHYIFNAYITI